jgi:hypothetical protein
MPDNFSTASWLWGALISLLALQFVWAHFVAYPARFERMLRKGRTWIYIPLRWKGLYKLQVLFVSRLLVVLIALAGLFVLVHHTHHRHPLWVAGFTAACYFLALWLGSFWTTWRYRQQEDAYFLQLDELRAKMELENKEFTDVQLRNLSAYQHQQKLHRADEEGKFLIVLREEARRFRRERPAALPALEA